MMHFVLAAFIWYTVGPSRIFYPPAAPAVSFTHMTRVLSAQPLAYRTDDGVVLRGFLFRAVKRNAPYVLLFYGNAELTVYERNRLAWLRGLGYNAACFDYRGYGYSDGRVDGGKIRNDSVALYDYVVRQLEASHAPAFVYGVSLGTQFAIHVAAMRHVRGLLLQSPPASADEEVRWYAHHYYGIATAIIGAVPSAQVREVLQGAVEIRRSTAPVIVVHGAQDALIPIVEGREVYAAAATRDKRFIELAHAGHGDIRFSAPPAGPAVVQFLSTH